MYRAAEPSGGSAAFRLAARTAALPTMQAQPAAGQESRDAMEEGGYAEELTKNGHQTYAWRIVDGETRLVVVAIGFTIPGLAHESFEAFEARMRHYVEVLGRLQHTVVSLTVQQRLAHGGRHWAEFECETPEAGLPVSRQ